jgi:hypothetical protein
MKGQGSAQDSFEGATVSLSASAFSYLATSLFLLCHAAAAIKLIVYLFITPQYLHTAH